MIKMDTPARYAPGAPGANPHWTSSAKSGVGTALNRGSRVWFTLKDGVLNEIYYPRVDQACTEDMGLIVTDGRDFFSEEKRHTSHKLAFLDKGVPGFRLVNTCEKGRYRITKEIITDPARDVLLQHIEFVPQGGSLNDFRLYVLLAPHLGNKGNGNTAWVDDFKGTQFLFAEGHGYALALACSAPWLNRSVGFVGVSDGWHDLVSHRKMLWNYTRAEKGVVALTGEVDLQATGGAFVLALGFGQHFEEAGHFARASLLDGFSKASTAFISEWQDWQKTLPPSEADEKQSGLQEISKALIRVHEAKYVSGGMIASLSIPWGFTKGDDDLGGYHLVWTRDLVETGGALLAMGAREDAGRVLRYLQVTQEDDGHWPQNMWIDGTPFWSGVQMDETALPILLTDMARREGVLNAESLARFWPMVRQAATFLVCNGPVTQEDRWEEDPGYSPFTLAAEIAALLAAADFADLNQEHAAAVYLRETADAWNASIDKWVYVTGTDLAHQVGVEGYYVRIAPPEVAESGSPAKGFVPIKNRPPGQSREPAGHIVSPDALALVRFGLRTAGDTRILSTLKLIDTLLRVETPRGPAWHRYNDDGYGEHKDGRPFDGTGSGRAWPLLTGERAHYELMAGRREEAERLLHALEKFAGEENMIPEQVWDTTDIPDAGLFLGQPTGSARPLVWAHAEYLKLCRSLRDNCVFDQPPQPVQRYLVEKTGSPYAIWRFNQKCRTVPITKTLRVELRASAVVRWSTDVWHTVNNTKTRDTGMGIHIVDLPTSELRVGTEVQFTFYWPEADRWEGTNFTIQITAQTPS
jgi:glucoamylase